VPSRLQAKVLALLIGVGCLATIGASPLANHGKSESVSRHVERSRRHIAASQQEWGNVGTADETRPANFFLAQYGPEGTARAVRTSLIEAARPDARVFLAIGAVIVLLRILRDREQMCVGRQATSRTASSNQSSTSAAQDVKKLRAA